jgi:signal peptidase I
MLPPDPAMSLPLEPPVPVSPHPNRETVVPSRPRSKSVLREYAEAFTMALVLALLIRAFVVQAFKIPSGSMLPTLQIGDHILVNKFVYGFRLPVVGTRVLALQPPQRGDVVVFEYPVDPSKDFIKRTVGLPGDVVQIRSKRVYINGALWDDPHAFYADGRQSTRRRSLRDNYGPVTVPPHQLFVMGDNRDHSYDSRFWGFVDLDEVKGKAFLIYWSWDGDDRWVRWERLGRLIH